MSSSSCIIINDFKGRYINDPPETISYVINPSILLENLLIGFEFDSDIDNDFLCNKIIDFISLLANGSILYTEASEVRRYILLKHKYTYHTPFIKDKIIWVHVFYGNIIKFLTACSSSSCSSSSCISLNVRLKRIIDNTGRNLPT